MQLSTMSRYLPLIFFCEVNNHTTLFAPYIHLGSYFVSCATHPIHVSCLLQPLCYLAIENRSSIYATTSEENPNRNARSCSIGVAGLGSAT
jgi:hypothetical protein